MKRRRKYAYQRFSNCKGCSKVAQLGQGINLLEAVSKTGFWFKVKAGSSFNPPRLLAGSSKYVEDLKREPNADIGPKDIFEIASNLDPSLMLC